MLTAQMGAKKWGQNLGTAGEAIRQGVQQVTQAPTAKAAANLDKAKRNYNQAIDSGRTAARLNAVTLGDWQQAMLTTGLSRISSGVQKGQAKYEKFAAQFYPVMQSASEAAKAMPNNSIEDGLARVRVVIERAKQFAGKI